MKKFFLLALVAASLVACNSDTSSNSADTDSDTAVVIDSGVVEVPVITYHEGDVIRKDGKVSVWKEGNWVVVEKDIVLDNGVVIAPNGNVKSKEGKVIVLEEGAYVNRTGNFFDRAGNAIQNAWDATKTGVSNAAEATKEGVKDAADATKDGLKDAGKTIKSGAEKVGEKTKQIVDDLKPRKP